MQGRLREWANGFVAGRMGGTAGGGRSAVAWRHEIPVALVAGICLGVLGPFGTYLNGSLAVRTGYWVTTLLGGTCILLLAWEAGHRVAARFRWWTPVVVVALSLLASVPIAVLSHTLAIRVWGGPVRDVPALTWFAQTLTISGMLTLVHVGVAVSGNAGSPAPPAQAADGGPAGDFRARLPPHLGRDLLALQMEDHYVRAHTRLGSALILIPLHQAIRELDSVPGLRIHRSWWVAGDAVAGAEQQGRSVRLRLSNGVQAPVARAAVAEVRAAGWLASGREAAADPS